MGNWIDYFNKGKKYIEMEDFENARKFLEEALQGCPDSDSDDAGQIIFEIARAFFGKGMKGIAIKKMLAAVKMGTEEEHVRNMISCLVNEYGMPRQLTRELDDEAAFTAIHMQRYLYMKKSGKFGTKAEIDMIQDLIGEAWGEFRININLKGLKTREKIQKYREYVIFFPTFYVPDYPEEQVENIFYGEFSGDLCSCGSGLPYMWCCGRITAVDELLHG
jgi:tetratricopeptide (TPR) repeat protein